MGIEETSLKRGLAEGLTSRILRLRSSLDASREIARFRVLGEGSEFRVEA